jgi:hypothetical protein
MSALCNFAASIPPTQALRLAWWSGMSESAFAPCILFVPPNIGKRVDLWIDYPQSVAAGIFALSYFQKSRLGQLACAALIATPLVCKTLCMIAGQKRLYYRIAVLGDHICRLGSKAAYLLATWQFTRAQKGSQWTSYGPVIMPLLLLVRDLYTTWKFAQSAMWRSHTFYEWKVEVARVAARRRF